MCVGSTNCWQREQRREGIKAGKELLKKGTDAETAHITEEIMKDAKEYTRNVLDSAELVLQWWTSEELVHQLAASQLAN